VSGLVIQWVFGVIGGMIRGLRPVLLNLLGEDNMSSGIKLNNQ
jgi:hypothetical protein